MELTIQLRGNDNCYMVEYEPDTGIEEVVLETHRTKEQVVVNTEGLFVAQGEFPDIKTVPLIDELNRLAEIEFVDRRADYEDMKRDEALEHRMEVWNDTGIHTGALDNGCSRKRSNCNRRSNGSR